MLTADAVIARLGLRPHPEEGGFFAETYRAAERLEASGLPPRYGGPRAVSTAIYYLLTPETVSALHRLASDEVFHFYLGDPVEMLHLLPDRSHRVLTLGQDLTAGMTPQSGVELLSFITTNRTLKSGVAVTDLSGNVLWTYDPGLPAGVVANPINIAKYIMRFISAPYRDSQRLKRYRCQNGVSYR